MCPEQTAARYPAMHGNCRANPYMLARSEHEQQGGSALGEHGMRLHYSAGSATDPGAVREINEDACLSLPERGIWAVADGMGGHSSGDRASRTIIEHLERIPSTAQLAAMVDAVENALFAANEDLLQLAITERKHTIGSTVTVLLVAQQHALCLWAGDSRAYRLRHGEFEQLTQDHAMVEEMVQVGLLAREEAEKHPHANRITRAIGAAENIFLDMEIYRIQRGDRFLLCTDGLYRELSEQRLAAVLSGETDADGQSQQLVREAVARNARDNVTAVVVHIN